MNITKLDSSDRRDIARHIWRLFAFVCERVVLCFEPDKITIIIPIKEGEQINAERVGWMIVKGLDQHSEIKEMIRREA